MGLIKKADAEKKALEAEAKKKAMEEAEIKRQEMLAAQKEKGGKSQAPAMDARKELSKSKEQVEEECRISLNIRLKPLQLDAMDSDELKNKAKRIWESIVTLETDKYDYEQRRVDQDYELKELNERRKLQLRNKAIKKGLDPEAFCVAHPPTIHMFSKYERRTDTRTYGDWKKLYEGGAEIIRAEWLETVWKEKLGEWNKRPKAKLPKWCGVRPGKKEGDPETPWVRRPRPRLKLKRSMKKKRRSMTRRKRNKHPITKLELLIIQNIPYISLLPTQILNVRLTIINNNNTSSITWSRWWRAPILLLTT